MMGAKFSLGRATAVASLACLVIGTGVSPASASTDTGRVFATTARVPALQYPEGITAWHGFIFVGTLNVASAADSRILVFDQSHHLVNEITGPNDAPIGFMNGLIINYQTGDLFAAGNEDGVVYRIQDPTDPDRAKVSVYATLPTVSASISPGPEDMVFNQFGELYVGDSNDGLIYKIRAGGCGADTSCPMPWIGPSGARVSSIGDALDPLTGQPVHGDLFAAPVPGLAPNSLAFSPDFRTLYVANTGQDAIDAFPVVGGQVTGPGRILVANWNPALETDPTPSGYGALLASVQGASIGSQASTPLNGVDGLATDENGNIWADAALGDNIAEISPNGKILKTYGASALTQGGLLNMPSSVTFSGNSIYTTNLGIFSGLAGTTTSWSVVSYNVGVTGAYGLNGNL